MPIRGEDKDAMPMSQPCTSTSVPLNSLCGATIVENDVTMLTPTKVQPGPSKKTNTPRSREKLAKVLSPDTNGTGVPSPFKNNLLWPGSPIKNSKVRKSFIKLPAVVSSREYQAYDEKRTSAKKKEEEQKAERKRAREDRKNKGKNKTGTSTFKNPRRKIIEDSEDDWTCKVCKKRFSAEKILNIGKKWIDCDSCKSPFHYKCIPKKHRNN